MVAKLHTVLLKSIPYLLSIAGGAALYLLTKDEISDPSLADLVTNMAASLLSIPLVFLLYDYSNYLIDRRLSKERQQQSLQTKRVLSSGKKIKK